jgi:outer membrane biogenesis lipoprotein LolB
MTRDRMSVQRTTCGLLLLSTVACLVVAGCSEIQPEPNVEGGGEIQSQTHEQDSLREEEDRGEEGGRR